MSERNLSSFIPITVILAVFVYLEFSLFSTYGAQVSAAIEAETEINPGSMIYLFTAFIVLILSVFSYVLISINLLKNEDKQSFKKIIFILTCIVLVIFLIQIVAGLLEFMNLI